MPGPSSRFAGSGPWLSHCCSWQSRWPRDGVYGHARGIASLTGGSAVSGAGSASADDSLEVGPTDRRSSTRNSSEPLSIDSGQADVRSHALPQPYWRTRWGPAAHLRG